MEFALAIAFEKCNLCFGPYGGVVVFENESICNGMDIMKTMPKNNGFEKYVQSTLDTIHNQLGDGTKTAIIVWYTLVQQLNTPSYCIRLAMQEVFQLFSYRKLLRESATSIIFKNVQSTRVRVKYSNTQLTLEQFIECDAKASTYNVDNRIS